ncbi:MAG: hypothetical protein WCS89_01365 [Candidatus Paceibacterota bacterium]|jgi:hypothetical protein
MQYIHIKKWVPDLAYVVGLLVTDGCLSSDGRHVIFTSKDIEAVNNVLKILGATNSVGKTINERSEAYRIQIGSIELYRWLESIGLTPHKSLTIESIKVPDEYFIDFLRGHLDGDGSITTYLDKYNTKKNKKYVYQRLWVRFISGSQKHIIWLRKQITKIIGVKDRIHITKPNNIGNSIYVIKFGKKESIKLLSKIYYSNTLPCLTRKRTIYKKFKNS